MHMSVQALKNSGCVSFCVELHHSVQRKKQMKMILNSCTFRIIGKAVKNINQQRKRFSDGFWQKWYGWGRGKWNWRNWNTYQNLKRFLHYFCIHVLTGCASFCICWYFCVRNITKAGYLVLCMCVCNLLVW